MLIDDLKEIALEAGKIVRKGFGQSFGVKYKTNVANIVTEIDEKSEKYITDTIREKYPEHGILAEEGGEIESDSEYTWVIDPLDGTTNFAHGLPIFSVSIGILKGTETVAGVVYDVMQDVLYSAVKDKGAYKNDEKISVNDQSEMEKSLLVTGFPYDISLNPENAIGIFSAFVKKARGIRRLGSAAIDFCYVAAGVFDGFWEVHLHPWDICAGKLIVEEAGGRVTDFDGKDIDIFSKRILCSNGALHNSMQDLIKGVLSKDN